MANKKCTKYKSNKQEKSIAKDIGGSVTIASGCLDFQKADVRSDKFLVEAKTTEKTYYSLTTKTWEKIREQAYKDNLRTPVMCIDLRDGKNSIAIIEWNDLMGMKEFSDKQYVGNPVPEFIDNKSYRVTPDFLYEDFSQKYDGIYYRRHDIKFLDIDKRSKIVINRHLVMLNWDDFVALSTEL